MKALSSIIAITFSLNLWAQTQDYLLLSHDPAFLERNASYTKTVIRKGRTYVVTLNQAFETLPLELQKNLEPIKTHEIINQEASLPFAPQDADPRIVELTKLVKPESVRESIRIYSDLEKRATSALDIKKNSGNKLTMDMLALEFKAQGLEVSTQCYKKRKFDNECNIIGIKRSLNPAAKNYVVMAHLDSVGWDKAAADDNASGLAGLIEVTRITKNLSFDNNIVFVAVNGEETGLNGSTAYVAELKKNGRLNDVLGVLVMDMIAYNKKGNILNLETNNEFLDYVEWVGVQAKLYTSLTPKITTPAWGSDHVPFLKEKIPTFLLIENWEAANPCYHKACDTLANVDANYTAEMVKLNLAVTLQKAGLSSNL